MTLGEELQIAYRLVKDAIKDVKVDNLAEYDMLLAAGFRSAWASAWQRSRQVRSGPNAQCAGSNGSSNTRVEYSPIAITAGIASGTPNGTNPNLSEAVGLNQSVQSPTSGARGVVLGLLRTHALTTRQYKKLCEVLNVAPGRHPSEQEAAENLLERQALEVLVADGR